MNKRAILLSCLLLPALPILKHKPPKRPHILGIAGVTILVSNIEAAHAYYRNLIDPEHICEYCQNVPPQFLFLPSGQRITFKRSPTPAPADLLAEISFVTEDLDGLRRYLKHNKIQFDEIAKQHGGDLVRLVLDDSEHHHISFTDSYNLANAEDLNAGLPPARPSSPIRIIHAGLIVNDLAAMDHFYKDILGFRPYWHGGMKDDETSWVALQVPDGTDWIEYMLHISPSANKHTLGVMNHIALGVTDIHSTEAQLDKIGVKYPEPPKIGRDGKWQLNLYDADDTRIEFMEFRPVQKPCCSEFTGPHPEPH